MNKNTTILSEEGYMILPILDDLESTEWNQKQKEIEDYLSKIEEVDEDDEEFDDTDSSLTLEEYKRAERKKSDGLFKSRTLNLNHRMWSLACLQRSGAVSFLGFYPKEVAISHKTSEAIMLEDLLQNLEAVHAFCMKNAKPKVVPNEECDYRDFLNYAYIRFKIT